MLHRRNGYPINPYTGFERGSYFDWQQQTDSAGRTTLIGLFPVGYPAQKPQPGLGAYPGLH